MQTVYKSIREIGLDRGEAVEVMAAMRIGNTDFEVADYRFILDRDIDEIQCDELEGDTYILGCFNASFLAGVTDLPEELIKAAQEGEKFEAVGEAILDGGFLKDVQQGYASADGYGAHFAHYDGEDLEIWTAEASFWHAFRTN